MDIWFRETSCLLSLSTRNRVMASQESTFFNSLIRPGSRDVALDAEVIRELIDWTVLFSEDDMIGIKTLCAFNKDNVGGDLG